MPMIKPITGNFTYTQRINGWAKLIHLTKSGGSNLSDDSLLAKPLIISAPIVKIQNRPCDKPFVVIRKWRIWLMGNSYREIKCYH
jgi:hypothetical protein